MIIKRITFILSVLVMVSAGCGPEEVTLSNDDLVFPNSTRIKIPAYRYISEAGRIYELAGDTGYINFLVDTVDSMPVFKWDSLGLPLVAVTVATSKFIINDNEIENRNDIIWQWNSGMEFGKEGTVKLSEGKNVINGAIAYDENPEPLTPGRNYYWAIWAWNSSGTNILYSSRPLEFHVIN